MFREAQLPPVLQTSGGPVLAQPRAVKRRPRLMPEEQVKEKRGDPGDLLSPEKGWRGWLYSPLGGKMALGWRVHWGSSHSPTSKKERGRRGNQGRRGGRGNCSPWVYEP